MGPFPTSSCPVHRGHFGGGKPPSPTFSSMQHAGPLACTERKAQCHRTVCKGSIEKEAAASGGGAEGEHREILQGIWGAAGKFDGI